VPQPFRLTQHSGEGVCHVCMGMTGNLDFEALLQTRSQIVACWLGRRAPAPQIGGSFSDREWKGQPVRTSPLTTNPRSDQCVPTAHTVDAHIHHQCVMIPPHSQRSSWR